MSVSSMKALAGRAAREAGVALKKHGGIEVRPCLRHSRGVVPEGYARTVESDGMNEPFARFMSFLLW
jgi:hypothetical protein